MADAMISAPQWTQATEDRLVQAVLLDRARRWGIIKRLEDEELARWVSLQVHSKEVRADVKAMLTSLADAGLLDRYEAIMLALETSTTKRHGCGRIRLDHAAPPYGPYCLLEADHVGECEWPYPFDHAHENGKCVAPPPHGGVE